MKYEYWFANIKGINNRRKIEVRNYFQRIEELFFLDEWKMMALGIAEKEKKILIESIKTWDIEGEYRRIEERAIRCVPYFHKDYPEKLKQIDSPPYMLYVKGKLPDPKRKTVAMVGARNCSHYGEYMAKEYAETLAKAGVQIVSGMARGIDGISQRSAIAAGGSSFAVLGCDVNYCYPQEHMELYSDLIKCGGVLSELPIGTMPLKQYFPARNRIISGLSDAVLVIEAKERSGTLITTDMALEQGRDVYALPGPTNSQLSRGCNLLIKQGAGILLSPEELLVDLGLTCTNVLEKSELTKNSLVMSEKLLYSCLGLYPQNLEELIQKTRMSVPEILDNLISLELKGIIKEVSKNYYVRLK